MSDTAVIVRTPGGCGADFEELYRRQADGDLRALFIPAEEPEPITAIRF